MNALRTPANVPTAFTPTLRLVDPLAESWLAEATLRMRRELAWCWHRDARRDAAPCDDTGHTLREALDAARFVDERARWMAADATGRWLGERILAVREARVPVAGAWLALVHRLGLDECGQLALALALLAVADPASGAAFAECHHGADDPMPTLALVHRLQDDALPPLASRPLHALFRFGVLETRNTPGALPTWHQPFALSPLVAQALMRDDGMLPPELRMLADSDPAPCPAPLLHAVRSLADTHAVPTIVPLLGDGATDFDAWTARLATAMQRTVLAFADDAMPDPRRWNDIATWCWLHDVDVLLSAAMAQDGVGGPTVGAPVRWWWPLRGARTAARAWPGYALQPALRLPPTDFDTRVRRFHRALGAHAPALAEDIDGLAHRFRLAPAAMDAIGRAATVGETLDAPMLRALCRAHSRPDLGGLAHRVEPRFTLDELVLPDAQRRQLDEIAGAMDSLARVHHRWGAARAWNEAGLSVAFCGPPGTGKTMAAEALARALDLPMFRIDLSQVVDKYIGETEKNLQRVFDGAESCECVVFFDEADALFGKRTSVKDAHDRFANIEVSYLLERMERLKGMAILATNRRRDLDEAFLRRLRHLVEFPLPGLAERERLWRGMFPPGVDTDALDFAALAGLFPLAGGHIRSIAFNACLQAARESDARVDMAAVLRATKRELDKLHRPNAPEDFGAHADIVRPLFAEAQT